MSAMPERTNPPNSGEPSPVIRDRATSRHGDDCGCVRCRGFSNGNRAAEKHGAYADARKLSAAAERWANEIRESAPLYAPADEATIHLAAVTLARVERATRALDAVDEATEGRELASYLGGQASEMDRLRADLRGWINLASKLLDRLGCSPSSRAALGVDVYRARALSARRPALGDGDDGYDFSRLSPKQMIELEALVEAASVEGDDA